MFSIGISKEATDLEWQNFRPGSVQCHHGRLPSRATWQAHRNADTIHYTYCFTYIYIYDMICIYTDYFYDLYIYIPIPPTYTNMSLYNSSIHADYHMSHLMTRVGS